MGRALAGRLGRLTRTPFDRAAGTFVAMSVHIENPKNVTALLVAGTWLGVEQGTLERQDPAHGSSGSTEITYRWSHAGYRYAAKAGDVRAVQAALPAAAPPTVS